MALSRKSLLKTRLKNRLSKQEVDEVVAEIRSGTLTVSDLRPLLFETAPVLLFNFYWILATVSNCSTGSLRGLETDIFRGMLHHVSQESVVRSVLSVFKKADIPEEIEDELYAFCFGIIESPGSPIAHRSFALVVCARICKKYPALAGELLATAKQVEETYGAVSPGVRSAARQVSRMLSPC
ncbi:hypothetical protein [Leadbetterella sp. DM7]|uniref:hypothetical protein n=1 Tax=Leadbetterella sp. DM7 TaxID=3235085 RepID=UPI00349EF524